MAPDLLLHPVAAVVLRDPDTIARGRTLGLRIGGGPPEQLNEIMAKVTQIYAKVIKSANIKPD